MGDTVGLLPEDYIIFMAKKSGGTNGVYLKNFVKFHRLKGAHKQVCGAEYAALGNMTELHLCYAFLMLAYDGPTSSKSPTLDFIKPADVVNWEQERYTGANYTKGKGRKAAARSSRDSR